MIKPQIEKPIGLFDSGVGGLTVLHEISKVLPQENIIYLGDTARVPYGPKDPADVRRFVLEISGHLQNLGCKQIVIACNTGTATGLESAASLLPIPIMGVIEPGAQMAYEATRSGRIGIIGTIGTVNSGSYERAIKSFDGNIEVFSHPCHRFVDYIEDGITNGDEIYREVQETLRPLIEHKVDTLILGCTHYPMIEHIISDVMGSDVQIISSATATALKLKEQLGDTTGGGQGHYEFIATADPESFKLIGSRFLGREIKTVDHVTLEELQGHALDKIAVKSNGLAR